MSSPRPPSPSRFFSKVEKNLLKQYLISPCEPNECPTSPTHQGSERCCYLTTGIAGLYPVWIGELLDLLNQKSYERTAPRVLLRKLCERRILKTCIMQAICTSVFLYIHHEERTKDVRKYSELLDSSQQKLKAAIQSFENFVSALKAEDDLASTAFNIPTLNCETISVCNLAANCLLAAREIKAKARANFSQKKYAGQLSALSKLSVSQARVTVHLEGRDVSMAEISKIMHIVHEAITGHYPDRVARAHYSEFNLPKENDRLMEEQNLEALRDIELGLSAIVTGLSNRVEHDPEYDKQPRQVELSMRCSRIVDYGEDLKVFCDTDNDPPFDET